MAKKRKEAVSSRQLQQLFKDIHRQNRHELEKRLVELTAAFKIGQEAFSADDLERCLKLLMEKIAGLMSVEIISLMLLDPQRGDLVIKLAKGLDHQIVHDTKVKVGQHISGWIAKTGRPLLIKDITRDRRFAADGGKYYTNSLLSVPLKIGGRVIGVINVNNKSSKEVFQQADLSLLNTVAEMVSVAIQTSKIHGEAKALERLKNDFLAQVSHELKTPLFTVKESVAMILAGIVGTVTDDQRKFLELAKVNVDRLGRLVDNLLDLANLDAGGVLHRTQFDMTHLLETTVASMGPVARKNGILLRSVLPPRQVRIWGDEDKLSQVMVNLIENAVKYNRPDGLVEVTLEEGEETSVIRVRDTGIGIPAEDYEKIFERFYRVESGVKDKVKGTGLGLFLVKQIIEAHKGTITVESQPGEGSTFQIRLVKDLRQGGRGTS